MLVQMSSRGPDSAGVAVYRDPAPGGWSKLTLYSAGRTSSGPRSGTSSVTRSATATRPGFGRAAVFVVDSDADAAQTLIRERRPDLRVMSAGEVIEIYKETGLPEQFAAAFALEDFQGTHALGHTHGDGEQSHDRRLASVLHGARPLPRPQRLALEPQSPSREPTARGHRVPDRERHRGRGGLPRMAHARGRHARAGARRLSHGPRRLLHVRRRDRRRIAVLRDPIACKPAVLAETDEWVAMSSEWRAIAVLPGAADAEAWEPQPEVVRLGRRCDGDGGRRS